MFIKLSTKIIKMKGQYFRKFIYMSVSVFRCEILISYLDHDFECVLTNQCGCSGAQTVVQNSNFTFLYFLGAILRHTYSA